MTTQQRQASALHLKALIVFAILMGFVLTAGGQNAGSTSAGQKDNGLSTNFRCPESDPSPEESRAELNEFVHTYAAQFPDKTVGNLMAYRYQLLVSHSCTKTLQFMLGHISSMEAMVRFNGRDFGPKDEEFDPGTRVWTEYFDGSANGDDSLIFNFYGWEPPSSPESVAETFIAPRQGLKIIWKFQAPDDVTKAPAFFIVSETDRSEKGYGYVNLSKITSAGTSAYTVTYTKKFPCKNADSLDAKVKVWLLSDESKAIRSELGRVGADSGWKEYLTHTAGK
jgi:hypothetical protein